MTCNLSGPKKSKASWLPITKALYACTMQAVGGLALAKALAGRKQQMLLQGILTQLKRIEWKDKTREGLCLKGRRSKTPPFAVICCWFIFVSDELLAGVRLITLRLDDCTFCGCRGGFLSAGDGFGFAAL